uniref:Glycosylphosphatidylinositol anchor attachment 1 protein n=1 Tax=Mucochytrium quahogii TaxID=96639 RepID=A0A7S2RRP3_9STRA|mmetsp:Transcript_14120/g.23078  ORF Transcript_14120/g.23078 Transcript_14120/m.23078 type:complete len:658 (+) Transcript_14120:145-2118(+)|eukprot:CAMPEP_0203794542 /NCGR_PEP_ID=MMETSP0100_2-20121128/6578_1 /ASSEMBLY_ACC=CAM_ASM_000210 /TAXON_ID=96639 /ORGANISM=" , Strain NY0313808BC1" /LENGTH=657 /DNA_ID=CAMNT_0050698643 /DNA_START=127 /DNA_END=2100 /DNA_ORIENTATION=+
MSSKSGNDAGLRRRKKSSSPTRRQEKGSSGTDKATRVEEGAVEKVDLSQTQATRLHRLIVQLLKVLGGNSVAFGVVFYILGVVWVFLFPVVCITTGESKCRGTYFSENALSPGAGHSSFIRESLGRAKYYDGHIGDYSGLRGLMREAGMSEVESRDDLFSGVLRPRGGVDRREAIVLVSKLFSGGGGGRECCSSLSLGLSVMEGLSKVDWLSKNVIFVASASEERLAKWVHDYHYDINSTMSRAGIIIGGLVLSFDAPQSGKDIQQIKLLAPGINGQLPNLDLMNVLVYLSRNEGMEVDFSARKLPWLQQASRSVWHVWKTHISKTVGVPAASARTYRRRIETQLGFMDGVAFGPTGWHAHLLPYNIHAVSIDFGYAGRESRLSNEQFISGVGRVTALTFRSLSNLEEKFHQSYFLYVLPDVQLFVSIGEYSGSLALVLSPMLLQFISKSGNSPKGGSSLRHLSGALCVVSVAMCLGFLVFHFLPFHLRLLYQFQAQFEYSIQHMVGISVAVLFVVQAFFQMVARVFVDRESSVWQSVKWVLMLVLVLVHALIGMFNYPFAFFCGCVLSPFYATIGGGNPLKRLIWMFLWVLTSVAPFVFLLPRLVAAPSEWDGLDQDPLGALISMYTKYGVLLFPYICLVHVPAHLLSLGVILFAE